MDAGHALTAAATAVARLYEAGLVSAGY